MFLYIVTFVRKIRCAGLYLKLQKVASIFLNKTIPKKTLEHGHKKSNKSKID